MARIDSLEHYLDDVADAIREKTGGTEDIAAVNFDAEIRSITGGLEVENRYNDDKVKLIVSEEEPSEEDGYINMWVNPTGEDEKEYDSGWITPNLINGWVRHSLEYCPFQCRRIGTAVYLRGMVRHDDTLSDNNATRFVQLAEEFIPEYDVYVNTVMGTGTIRLIISGKSSDIKGQITVLSSVYEPKQYIDCSSIVYFVD